MISVCVSYSVTSFKKPATHNYCDIYFRGHDKVGSLGGLSYTGVSVAILGDEELAVGGDDSKTHIYTIADAGASLAESATVETRSPVTALSYSPAGDVLAIGDNGRQVEVYERGSWAVRIKGKWVFHTSKITVRRIPVTVSYSVHIRDSKSKPTLNLNCVRELNLL